MLLNSRFSNINIFKTNYRFLTGSQTKNLTLALSNQIYKPKYDLKKNVVDQILDSDLKEPNEKFDTRLLTRCINKNRDDIHHIINSYTKLIADTKTIIKRDDATIKQELFDDIEKQIYQLKKDLIYGSCIANDTDNKYYLHALENELCSTKYNMYNSFSELSDLIEEIKTDKKSDYTIYIGAVSFLAKIVAIMGLLIILEAGSSLWNYFIGKKE